MKNTMSLFSRLIVPPAARTLFEKSVPDSQKRLNSLFAWHQFHFAWHQFHFIAT